MLTHHAFLIYADSLEASSVPEEYRSPSIDTMHVVRERLSIADARELAHEAQQRPFDAPFRVFVIVADDIAVEAQNALLKLFEEPSAYARFYLVTPTTALILPTLRSRLHLIEAASGIETENDLFNAFRSAQYAERLSIAARYAKEKDSTSIELLLQGAETAASESRLLPLQRTVLFARTYIRTKGASAKMLLEELALVLPHQ